MPCDEDPVQNGCEEGLAGVVDNPVDNVSVVIFPGPYFRLAFFYSAVVEFYSESPTFHDYCDVVPGMQMPVASLPRFYNQVPYLHPVVLEHYLGSYVPEWFVASGHVLPPLLYRYELRNVHGLRVARMVSA